MSTITLKGIIDEDFVNYKVPSMTLMFPKCSFKCEIGKAVCQNSKLALEPDITVDIDKLCQRYLNNKISRAIVCQGLEPMDSFDELLEFVKILRNFYKCDDEIALFTGYFEHEISDEIALLSEYKNIIVKFGRYLPDQEPHYDEVLGIKLASDNQYGKRIS